MLKRHVRDIGKTCLKYRELPVTHLRNTFEASERDTVEWHGEQHGGGTKDEVTKNQGDGERYQTSITNYPETNARARHGEQ